MWKRIIKMTKQEIFYDKEKTRPVTDFEVDEGEIILRGSWGHAEFFVFGDSRVKVIEDNAGVFACDSSRVYLKGNAARVCCENSSTVYRYGYPVHSDDSEWNRTLRIDIKPSLRVWLFDNSSFCSYSYAKAWLRDCSEVNLYCEAMVWRYAPPARFNVTSSAGMWSFFYASVVGKKGVC